MTPQDFWRFAEGYLDLPYIFGADGPTSFDCSGLAQFLLAHLALDPPGDQNADTLYRHFSDPQNGVPVGLSDAHCGTLVFYGKPSRVGHIAVCLTPTLMIEAGGGGPETISVEIAKKTKAKVRVRPIRRRPDIVGLRRPVRLPWGHAAPDPEIAAGLETR